MMTYYSDYRNNGANSSLSQTLVCY